LSEILSKHEFYINAFTNTLNSVKLPGPNLEILKKLVFYGVIVVNTKPATPNTTWDEALWGFRFSDMVQKFMGSLTPQEFVDLFPIAKDYDNDTYTHKCTKALPNKPIGEIGLVMDFLREYHNQEIYKFVANFLSYENNLRKVESSLIAEDIAAKSRINSRRLFTDPKSKKFDNGTEKYVKISKKRPSHLKLVVPYKKENIAN
jgi:hypothetical protein